jgi:acetolactate synthase-1/2/3 large subunit
MDQPAELPDHGGTAAIAAAAHAGVDTLWTLSGAHIFPLYDAATRGQHPMRILDVRHEQTAVFGAEAQAKLTRRPGLAALTAGPGVTNGVSAITTAWFNGSPVVVIGGRAPQFRWGSGALQELDHPPILREVTKLAGTVSRPELIGAEVAAAFQLATSPHRGPVFLDVPMDHLYTPVPVQPIEIPPIETSAAAAADVDRAARLWAAAQRPLLILGSDVWTGGAEAAALRLAELTETPTITNGMGRGVVPGGHPLLATRARSTAVKNADVVIVVGTPLDFRLGYGSFGAKEKPAKVVHIVDDQRQLAGHAEALGLVGDLSATLGALTEVMPERNAGLADWHQSLREAAAERKAADAEMLRSDSDPIHPGRVYGELLARMSAETVVIGDGGDFVSFAGRFIEPAAPGRWLDPGPYGCLGTGLGYSAAARLTYPDDPIVLLLGDGAAGFSLLDVDTLVRHGLPVVMVVGNNGAWGLEKHPMQMLYGYDVAADLQPATRYDEVVRALGGGGETVTAPAEIGPALDRAFAAGVPYLVNVITDPDVAYPRSTTGI